MCMNILYTHTNNHICDMIDMIDISVFLYGHHPSRNKIPVPTLNLINIPSRKYPENVSLPSLPSLPSSHINIPTLPTLPTVHYHHLTTIIPRRQYVWYVLVSLLSLLTAPSFHLITSGDRYKHTIYISLRQDITIFIGIHSRWHQKGPTSLSQSTRFQPEQRFSLEGWWKMSRRIIRLNM